MTCRYCNQPIAPADETHTFTYWAAVRYPCHKQCKVEGIRAEAYECQLIDADCNDCKHFKRGKLIERWLSCMINDAPAYCLTRMGIVTGHCLKFNRPTTAQPNKWTGLECFEHRRATQ